MNQYQEIDALVEAYKYGQEYPEDSPERENARAACQMLVMTFKPLILAALSRSRITDDRFEDAFQDGVVAFIEGLKKFDPGRGTGFNAFMQGYLKRYYLKWNEGRFNQSVTAEKSLDSPLPGDEALTLADTLADDQVSVETDYIAKKEKQNNRKRLAKGLSRLSTAQRSVVKGYYHEGLSMSEIALKQGISRQAVQNRHAYAIKKLKKVF
ncbi:sigma-70 family RNA polymerase sigma factor [Eubacterium sp. 1001713B170207_170306_E7]|uniref:sigma-70 family RNA polymerase sigma factor n=1 Tax=Eubacterium sp. 1001713B170207_170306_E7 TaxID=2787097 RepID=UPI001898572B|nr:sigma-70 family RNA polymerase sigma factor [Eubacterium sp. 1001713B170207_170306_E7]